MKPCGALWYFVYLTEYILYVHLKRTFSTRTRTLWLHTRAGKHRTGTAYGPESICVSAEGQWFNRCKAQVKVNFHHRAGQTANATERGGEGRAQNGATCGQEQTRGWMFALPVVGLDSEVKDHPVRK